jgi:D-alanyl-D-alanine dipeptidase
MAMLDVQEISTYYGHIQALKGVSIEVDQGEIVTLIADDFRPAQAQERQYHAEWESHQRQAGAHGRRHGRGAGARGAAHFQPHVGDGES